MQLFDQRVAVRRAEILNTEFALRYCNVLTLKERLFHAQNETELNGLIREIKRLSEASTAIK